MANESFWSKLKSFSGKVVEWFKKLVMKNTEMYKKYAPVAINIVNWMKDFNKILDNNSLTCEQMGIIYQLV